MHSKTAVVVLGLGAGGAIPLSPTLEVIAVTSSRYCNYIQKQWGSAPLWVSSYFLSPIKKGGGGEGDPEQHKVVPIELVHVKWHPAPPSVGGGGHLLYWCALELLATPVV